MSSIYLEHTYFLSHRRSKPFEVIVGLDHRGEAFGELYWDDGDSIGTWEKRFFNLIEFRVKDQKLRASVNKWGYESTMNLSRVSIFGVTVRSESANVTRVVVNNGTANCPGRLPSSCLSLLKACWRRFFPSLLMLMLMLMHAAALEFGSADYEP
ncbi:unnamed protein product [Notodromas monacha]|uniref:Uncharacterized protein n=1 Tax=Notodromas monacha TaxID=399045 RepID=A0A7R9BQQ2_9CRUS|nr:unnamed protein product [Notodromas monacha]CAG0918574.1 unnamed protein product [Notodromas monacha]